MGKLVTFWSPFTGQAKVTSSLCAIAGMFGLQYPEISVAVSHIKQNSMELEEKLDNRSGWEAKQELYKKAGIAALKLNYRHAMLTPEKIRRSAIPLRMRSLFLYPNTEQEMDSLTFRLLTEDLKKEYDAVFLDLESGKKDNSMLFLKAADFVVVVLPQSPVYWECFFKQEAECLEGKNFCILLGGYLENSRYKKNYYSGKKEFKEKGKLAGVIPINAGFLDAMSEGRTLDYFFRNQRVKKKEENYGFIVQTKKAAECIKKNIFLS